MNLAVTVDSDAPFGDGDGEFLLPKRFAGLGIEGGEDGFALRHTGDQQCVGGADDRVGASEAEVLPLGLRLIASKIDANQRSLGALEKRVTSSGLNEVLGVVA